MYIIFAMGHVGEQAFYALPGARSMLLRLQERGAPWSFLSLGKDDPPKDMSHTRRVSVEKKDMIFVTDLPDLARKLTAEGICTVGYQPDSDGFFSGAENVITTFDGLETDYFENCLKRFHGQCVVIARTKRLVIRESVDSDFLAIYEMMREADGSEGPDPVSENSQVEEDKYYSYIHQIYRFYGYGLWTVVRNDTDEVIGRCGLSPVVDDYSPEGRVEIGYMVARKYRRRGYAYEACEAILRFAMIQLECPCVYACISDSNIPSQNLARKLGFIKVGKAAHPDNYQLWMILPRQFRSARSRIQERASVTEAEATYA